jgi:hypothetical protein
MKTKPPSWQKEPTAQRQAYLRARRKNAGLVPIQVWVPKERANEIRDTIAKMVAAVEADSFSALP